MFKIKYYIIEHEDININFGESLFIVKAENKKQAFDYFWKEMGYDNQEVEDGYVPYYKKDFNVYEVDKRMKEDNSRLVVLY